MGLYPPFGWSYRIRGVVASFRFEPENRGWILLLVATGEFGGWCIL
jgi:hypothetical protein